MLSHSYNYNFYNFFDKESHKILLIEFEVDRAPFCVILSAEKLSPFASKSTLDGRGEKGKLRKSRNKTTVLTGWEAV